MVLACSRHREASGVVGDLGERARPFQRRPRQCGGRSMNKQTLQKVWDQTRQKYGVYLRLLDVIPDDQFRSNPVQGMRTPTEMVVHTSGSLLRNITQGIARGEVTADEASEDTVASGLASKADVVSFARTCWEEADAAVASIGDAELSALVPTPWDMTLPGWVLFNVLSDEFLHHRGQLYAYARVCGSEPPFIWSFGDNAPEFAPRVD